VCSGWLAGPVQEISDRFEASMLNRANDECETGQAHYSIESLARCVATRELADMLYRLECIGREGELEAAEVFFTNIQVEFEKLKSFLPQPNWMQTAEQQNDEKEKMKKAQEII